MKEPLSRRTFLRGLGVTMALPWLEAMTPLARVARAATPSRQDPKRFVVLYVPNGIIMDRFTPDALGENYEMPFILEPLKPFQKDLLVLSGLDQVRADAEMPGDHARAASIFLTGANLKKSGRPTSGTSVDQLAARSFGEKTDFPSLELGCETGKQAGQCNAGYSCVYTSTISWNSKSLPMDKDANPRLVFERLFGGNDSGDGFIDRLMRFQYDHSILDYLLEDTKRLNARLGKGDQQKLAEYQQSVRQLERRITAMESGDGMSVPTKYTANFLKRVPDAYQKDANYEKYVQLMLDLIVMALQTDKTRVATFMLADEFTNRTYGHLGIHEGHHSLSHHFGRESNLNKLSAINRFHVAQLAYFLGKLKETKEGETSLLDSSMVLYGSGLSDGNAHSHCDLPIILAGRGGGTLNPGRHIRFPEKTPLNNLHVTLLHKLEVPISQFGDSTGSLTDLG